MVFENYAFLLYSVEIGHILLTELPCIDSLKLYEYKVLALKNATHVIFFVLIPTFDIVVNKPQIFGVRVPENTERHIQVAESVFVNAGDQHGLLRVTEGFIYFRL